MPLERKAARRWLDAQERADRKNARIIDKLTIALPVELNRRQRRALVRTYSERVTVGRASWIAAIHQEEGIALKVRYPTVHKNTQRTPDRQPGDRLINSGQPFARATVPCLNSAGIGQSVQTLWSHSRQIAQRSRSVVSIDASILCRSAAKVSCSRSVSGDR